MKLKLKEEVRRPLRVRVTDSTGTVWRKVLKNDRRQVWTAYRHRAGHRGGEHHHEEVRRPCVPPGGGLHRRRRRWHAPAGAEDARRDERAGGRLGRSGSARSGAGLAARRIYADLAAGT